MTDVNLLSLRALAEAATPGARESLAGFAALVSAGILPKDDPELRNVMDMAKLVIAVPLLLDRVEQLESAIEECECDMHARIRAGYDTTVAAAWRAEVAKRDAEIVELKQRHREENLQLEAAISSYKKASEDHLAAYFLENSTSRGLLHRIDKLELEVAFHKEEAQRAHKERDSAIAMEDNLRKNTIAEEQRHHARRAEIATLKARIAELEGTAT